MVCATARRVRRSTLIGKQSASTARLDEVLARFEKEKITARTKGRLIGNRISVQSVGPIRGHYFSTFIHPTKKATRGRIVLMKSPVPIFAPEA